MPGKSGQDLPKPPLGSVTSRTWPERAYSSFSRLLATLTSPKVPEFFDVHKKQEKTGGTSFVGSINFPNTKILLPMICPQRGLTEYEASAGRIQLVTGCILFVTKIEDLMCI